MNPLQTFASGDTNYISKHNSNVALLQSTIGTLETRINGFSNSETNWTAWLQAMYGTGVVLLGSGSYAVAASGTSITVAAGSAWIGSIQKVVSLAATATINLVGVANGTYYVTANSAGTPSYSNSPTDAFYSFVWNGTTASAITRIAAVAPDFSDWAQTYTWATQIEINGWKAGAPSNGEVLLRYVVARKTTFANGLAGSYFKAGTAATASSVLSIKADGVQFATATFAASGTTATFADGYAVLNPGVVVTVVAPASADATLADLAFVLAGTKSA